MDVLEFVYSVTISQTLVLFPISGGYEESCSKNSPTGFFIFNFLVSTCTSISLDEVGVLGHMDKCMLNFKRNFQTLFESGSPVLHCCV